MTEHLEPRAVADELRMWLDLRAQHEMADNMLAADACDREILRIVEQHQAAILTALRRDAPAAGDVEAFDRAKLPSRAERGEER